MSPRKRYLCTVDEGYFDKLSPPSVVSLKLQGGKMSDDEKAEFETSPHWERALDLRRWDDMAKVVDLETPPIDHYLPMIEEVALPATSA